MTKTAEESILKMEEAARALRDKTAEIIKSTTIFGTAPRLSVSAFGGPSVTAYYEVSWGIEVQFTIDFQLRDLKSPWVEVVATVNAPATARKVGEAFIFARMFGEVASFAGVLESRMRDEAKSIKV